MRRRRIREWDKARALLSATFTTASARHEFLAAVAGGRRGVRVLPPSPARFYHRAGEEWVRGARTQTHARAPLPPDYRAQVRRCFSWFCVCQLPREHSTEQANLIGLFPILV